MEDLLERQDKMGTKRWICRHQSLSHPPFLLVPQSSFIVTIVELCVVVILIVSTLPATLDTLCSQVSHAQILNPIKLTENHFCESKPSLAIVIAAQIQNSARLVKVEL